MLFLALSDGLVKTIVVRNSVFVAAIDEAREADSDVITDLNARLRKCLLWGGVGTVGLIVR
jgi:hypothetical protein